MKITIFKTTLIIQLILLLVFYFFKENLLLHESYIDGTLSPTFFPYEVYFVLLIPTILLFVSLLLTNAFNNITNAERNNQLLEKNQNEYNNLNFWKLSFFINLSFCSSFIIYAILQFLVLGKKSGVLFVFFEYSTRVFIFTLAIPILSFIIGALLISTKLLWKTNKSVSLIAMLIGLFAFVSPLLIIIGMFNNSENIVNKPAIITDSQTSINDSIPAAQLVGAYNKEVEVNPDFEFSYGNLEHIHAGNFFSDLWDDPEKDKENVAYAIKTFLNKHLYLNKKGTLNNLKSSYSLRSFENTDKKVELVENKIDRKPERIIAAFKSYKDLMYYMLPVDIYEESGLKTVVKSLLCTHNDLYKSGNEIKNIENISIIMDTKFKHDIYIAQSYYELIMPYYSDDLFNILKSENISNAVETKSSPSDNTKADVVWAYSFWERRQDETNSKEIYEILIEIDEYYSN